MSSELHHISRVIFKRFKAFEQFTLYLRHFNILVGPNNSGKSTVLAAFRILAAALRKASARKPVIVNGPKGNTFGYVIDLAAVSVAEENIFYNYDDAEPAEVKFILSNKNELQLYFPERGACYLIARAEGRIPKTPTSFKKAFNCPIGFVPILGPVDHNEQLYQEETARLALYNYRASRNFRNIWYRFPGKFNEFRKVLKDTWPGMDIEAPVVDMSHGKPMLHMFCPEDRIPREIFWAGFGFQVWCQMLTHLIQSSEKALFLIDEPDIYLHSELQRQLLGLLRNLGPDILIATHSTEIITEAESDDIVLINKKRKHARRIKRPEELSNVFSSLGSNLNPILTQLARTRRVLFVEGKDFQILSKFARKLKYVAVGNRTNFAVVPVQGFSPKRIKNLKEGMEKTLGGKIAAAAILDRDYRSEREIDFIRNQCSEFCDYVTIHSCKEIENFLLIPEALDRAAKKRVLDHATRTGRNTNFKFKVDDVLNQFAESKKNYVNSQFLSQFRKFERNQVSGKDDATITEEALIEFDAIWSTISGQLNLIPGKEAMTHINSILQNQYKVSVTPTAIISAINKDKIPTRIIELIKDIDDFSKMRPGFRLKGS